ncbi:pyridoxal phosphate-dependent aminotransferase [Stackebrandtia nassauensis]|uniref:Aminotransferase n=1 Tax=Stackebrandtia nassauensis (strain DSM 44728 / CIP 108903 / NRRL B-16338 / NBRC 102104 / LLR-40K-21) TaxID=446470 RepID=D3Q9P5_STANL|nr:pyridoxal phosphate-dependent aminotransferase [Stackebrandtia nassauensis]ADD44591.1 aminotransferase class I and II [Stackebrandtia nassauensis DSM 44728]
MPVSATLAVNEAIRAKRESGKYVLPLGFGEAGLPVHRSLTDRLSRYAGRNGYGSVAGVPQLREAAAGYWSRRDLRTEPSQVIAGPGSKPLLYAALMAVGGDVVLPQPSWVSYGAQVEMLGATPLYVPTIPGDGGVPDPQRLKDYLDHARTIGRDVRAMVMTLPDNPTGTLAAPEIIHRACDIAREYDLVIIADEIYRDLVFDAGRAYVSPADIAPERTIITTGLSKSLALGGWRIGVARVPDSALGDELRERMLTIASEIWSSPSAPVQHAAAYAYTEPAELRDHIADSRRLHATVARAVAGHFGAAGAEVAVPDGGFYLYPDLAPYRSHLEAKWSVKTGADLSELLLDRYAVGVLPGSAFGDGIKELKLRVATSQLYGQTDAQREAALRSAYPLMLPWIAKALDRLDEVLKDLTR